MFYLTFRPQPVFIPNYKNSDDQLHLTISFKNANEELNQSNRMLPVQTEPSMDRGTVPGEVKSGNIQKLDNWMVKGKIVWTEDSHRYTH